MSLIAHDQAGEGGKNPSRWVMCKGEWAGGMPDIFAMTILNYAF